MRTINNRLAVLSSLLKYAGPRGCKLIADPTLSFHVDGMDAEVIAVPSAFRLEIDESGHVTSVATVAGTGDQALIRRS